MTEVTTPETAPKGKSAGRKARLKRYVKRKRSEKRVTGYGLLYEHWPNVFNQKTPVPLAVGLREKLLADCAQRGLELPETALTAAIACYTHRLPYLLAVAKGVKRVGIDGQPTERPTMAQRVKAVERLKESFNVDFVIPPRKQRPPRVAKPAGNVDGKPAHKRAEKPKAAIVVKRSRKFIKPEVQNG